VKNIAPYGTLLYKDDLFEQGLIYGVQVIRADSYESMQKALIETLSADAPVIINTVIDPENYQWLIVKR
jgi:thiamine pyrophosphate-dependent acetolactate synthase large subunit-like protein